jgi:CYTH domain-containing protein
MFRIRTAGDDAAFLTIKRSTDNAAVKDEYELPIPFDAARRIQNSLCEYFITKKRHLIDFQNVMWEVDVFSGALKGLVIAEVEAASLDAFTSMAMLPGVTRDITEVKRVSNYALGRYGIPGALVKKPEAGGPPLLGPT